MVSVIRVSIRLSDILNSGISKYAKRSECLLSFENKPVITDDIEEYEDTYPTYNESVVGDNNATVEEETTMSVKSVIVIQFIR